MTDRQSKAVEVVMFVAILTVVAGGCAVIPQRPGIDIDTTNGFVPYIKSIQNATQDELGEPVLMWFGHDPDRNAAGVMLRGTKLTIYEHEYADSNSTQRLVIAVFRLNVFVNDVEAQRRRQR